MIKKREDQFEILARLIKEEAEDIRSDVKQEIRQAEQRLERRMDEGFTDIKRQLDTSIQPQLDDHAHRIKALETEQKTPVGSM